MWRVSETYSMTETTTIAGQTSSGFSFHVPIMIILLILLIIGLLLYGAYKCFFWVMYKRAQVMGLPVQALLSRVKV
ncbi:envelope glycoprotein 150 [Wood mouse herpesvirus]|uniref:Envelope glycoprotein 150 n=1 Tax=Wood mouse herpesvirus TaxID=432370 RepID=D0PPB7_9GAMA|nr:envelope glycoprotein 150 [Wood mouse herpesvirus]ABO48408.1 type 1 envelope glycoprotein gp150 [Wood mouse herpesvirus]ACY41147.1 envelope glycoprotein 150 [Wood mouse herpesvirus]